MSKKKQETEKTEETFQAVEQTLSKSEQYIERNQKIVSWVLVGILGIFAIYLGYNRFIVEPNKVDAAEEIIYAQQAFEKDSFNLALNGDGEEFYGFAYIADTYSSTPMGQLAYYYAGICSMKEGDFESAIEYMSNYSGDDIMTAPLSKGIIGDANLELGNIDEAYSAYIEAAEMNENTITAPYYLKKAGMVAEMKGDYTKALEFYQRIKKEFKNSRFAQDIDKSIGRAKAQK